MVVEMQFVMEFTTTVIATIAMAAAGGFKEMKRESMVEYDLGHNMYWLTVMGNIISWQVCFMGTAGMVFLTTSLTGGVCMTALLALNVIGGVLVYGDNFSGPKAVSTVICAWGFCSYVYGLYVNRGKGGIDEKNRAKEMTQILIDEH
uniref:Purine permease 4 n=2 Tax=Chenopodium quinoa TaxID=63459 RepID=A0A803LQM4_CHEQI